jgi:4-hydroxybenzoate polyprenyltransferase
MFKYLPPAFLAALQLMRLDRPIGIWLLLWPTWIGLWMAAHRFPGWDMLLIFTAGTVLMRSAGCVINDYADRDIDGKVWRTQSRPLAEKRAPPRFALILAISLALVSAGLLFFLPFLCWWIAAAAVLCSTLYPWTKRFLPIPQAFLGITFSLGVLMAWAAIAHQLPLNAWILWLSNIAWVLAYDTAYAMADRPDDSNLGIHSSALWLGKYDVPAINGFTLLFLLGLAWLGFRLQLHPAFWIAWIGASLWCWQCNRQLISREPTICLKVFKQHHWAGALLWLGCALG